MNSPNKLQISIDHTADWWLGNLDDPWFKALEGAIRDEWGVDPLRIREGGVSFQNTSFVPCSRTSLSLYRRYRTSRRSLAVMPFIYRWVRAR